MITNRLILQGGFGNQLFQWAYSHYLYNSQGYALWYFFKKEYAVKHAAVPLANIMRDCAHGSFRIKQLPSNRVLRNLIDPTSTYNPLKNLRGYLQDYSNDPFAIPHRKKTTLYLSGYFQNWQIVDAVRYVVFKELSETLFKEGKSELERKLMGTQIVHIRQGDTLEPANRMRVGVLSRRYYENLPPKRGEKRYVITDDLVGASRLLKGLDFDGIYGPEEVNALAALRIMSCASKLFTANSTLSWWGGFLAIHQGGEVVIPHPFFRNVSPDPGEAFIFPEFAILSSDFIVENDQFLMENL